MNISHLTYAFEGEGQLYLDQGEIEVGTKLLRGYIERSGQSTMRIWVAVERINKKLFFSYLSNL